MIKSMTGFAKAEAKDIEKRLKAVVEIKSLNGRYLELNCKLPRELTFREFELRDMIKSVLFRGSVTLSVNVEIDAAVKPLSINEAAAEECYKALLSLNKKIKSKQAVTLDNLLVFSNNFIQKEGDDSAELEWKLVKTALKDALKAIDKMRTAEGQQILRDIQERVKNVAKMVEKVDEISLKKIPEERDRLRQRIAQLFESDEIDERRIQMEIVLIADKLDISEECVRLRSHIKFFNETLKAKEPMGQKLNFLIQEMNREINTIGSKANDTEISQLVVASKDEMERIREQIQNVE